MLLKMNHTKLCVGEIDLGNTSAVGNRYKGLRIQHSIDVRT